VGAEFASKDPGGKLPEKAKDMASGEWKLLRWLLGKFFAEEAAKPEHGEGEARDITTYGALKAAHTLSQFPTFRRGLADNPTRLSAGSPRAS
jgi:hypothetical protein